MMDIRPLDETLHATPQIALSDVADAAAKGYRAIISNRPDGEEPGQPTAGEMRAAADAAGLEFRHIPVRPGGLTDGDIDAMREWALQADWPAPLRACQPSHA